MRETGERRPAADKMASSLYVIVPGWRRKVRELGLANRWTVGSWVRDLCESLIGEKETKRQEVGFSRTKKGLALKTNGDELWPKLQADFTCCGRKQRFNNDEKFELSPGPSRGRNGAELGRLAISLRLRPEVTRKPGCGR